ncbi:hypothetical protein GCM10020218_080790 [Dactylosporangium vinaceum]
MARLEALVAFQALADRFSRVTADPADVRWLDTRYLRGPALLPVRAEPAVTSGR